MRKILIFDVPDKDCNKCQLLTKAAGDTVSRTCPFRPWSGGKHLTSTVDCRKATIIDVTLRTSWVDIEDESPPEDGVEVLGRCDRQGGVKFLMSYHSVHKQWRTKGDYISLNNVTHWMSIPKDDE